MVPRIWWSGGTAAGAGGAAGEPTIGPVDAVELCLEPYPTRGEALRVARRLRAAGWVVVEHDTWPPRRPDGTTLAASVYHPDTYESPGDVLVVPDRR